MAPIERTPGLFYGNQGGKTFWAMEYLKGEMEERSAVFSKLAECIFEGGAYKATKYLSESLTIKATRKRYQGKILKRGAINIVFTVGRPNYEEWEFIKKCKKAGEPFPVRKIQPRFPR